MKSRPPPASITRILGVESSTTVSRELRPSGAWVAQAQDRSRCNVSPTPYRAAVMVIAMLGCASESLTTNTLVLRRRRPAESVEIFGKSRDAVAPETYAAPAESTFTSPDVDNSPSSAPRYVERQASRRRIQLDDECFELSAQRRLKGLCMGKFVEIVVPVMNAFNPASIAMPGAPGRNRCRRGRSNRQSMRRPPELRHERRYPPPLYTVCKACSVVGNRGNSSILHVRGSESVHGDGASGVKRVSSPVGGIQQRVAGTIQLEYLGIVRPASEEGARRLHQGNPWTWYSGDNSVARCIEGHPATDEYEALSRKARCRPRPHRRTSSK